VFRFLHAADLHLDSPMLGLEQYPGCPADEIRGASRRALERLVALAIASEVAFVVIAGDLYDGDQSDYGCCLFLNEQLVRLREANIEVFVIQGNHDAASRMTRLLRPPANVHQMATDRPQTLHATRADAVIHGQGFATRAVAENLAAGYPSRVAGAFNLGLLHTSLDGREGHDDYAPCTIENLRTKNYDYWALGHIHKKEVLHHDPPIVFPGNLQGRHVKESGGKGATIVTVDGGHVVTQVHHDLDVLRWGTCAVDATGAVEEDELIERAHAALSQSADNSAGLPLIMRVVIEGECRAHDRIAGKFGWITAEVRSQARDVGGGRLWIEKVKVRTRSERASSTFDGPLRVVRDYLDGLRNDPTRLLELGGRELGVLKKKLPPSWESASGRTALDSLETLTAALEHIGPELFAGLSGASRANGSGDIGEVES